MKCLYQGQSRLQSHISYIIYESIPRTLALETDHGLVADRFDLAIIEDYLEVSPMTGELLYLETLRLGLVS